MKLRTDPRISVLAVDLDRTLLPPDGRPTATGRSAIRAARELGVSVILVSGRRFPELLEYARAFGGISALVAENGAVVAAPIGRRPIRRGFRAAGRIRRRLAGATGLDGEYGAIVASFPRSCLRKVRRVLGDCPAAIVPNVDRIMVLPPGITKGTGLRLAWRGLGLRDGGYAAVGDGENDVELLRGASLSGAVANATPALRRRAGWVSQEPFDAGVLEFVRGPLRSRLRLDRGRE